VPYGEERTVMEMDEAREILLGSGGQVVRIGSPLAQAIECVLAWEDRLGKLYDAREAEVQELLRERNAVHRRCDQIEDGCRADAQPPEVARYVVGRSEK
jgi:hypothetical protein